jgi:hypothetical protein
MSQTPILVKRIKIAQKNPKHVPKRKAESFRVIDNGNKKANEKIMVQNIYPSFVFPINFGNYLFESC